MLASSYKIFKSALVPSLNLGPFILLSTALVFFSSLSVFFLLLLLTFFSVYIIRKKVYCSIINKFICHWFSYLFTFFIFLCCMVCVSKFFVLIISLMIFSFNSFSSGISNSKLFIFSLKA